MSDDTTTTRPASEQRILELSRQLDALYAAWQTGALTDDEWHTRREPLAAEMYELAARDAELFTIDTPIVVAGELIESAWGNTVRADLMTLDSGKVGTTGNWSMAGLLSANGGIALPPGNLVSAGRVPRFDQVLNATGGTVTGGVNVGQFPGVSGPAGIGLGTSGQISSGHGADSATSLQLFRFGSSMGAGDRYVSMFRAGAQIGSISINSTQNGVNFNESSDRRLKDEIGPIPDALNRLRTLRPIAFTWRTSDPPGYPDEGFIADEVQTVVPQAVTGEPGAVWPLDDPYQPGAIDPQQLDTGKLIPLLTAAVQTLAEQNDALTARIEALEGAAT